MDGNKLANLSGERFLMAACHLHSHRYHHLLLVHVRSLSSLQVHETLAITPPYVILMPINLVVILYQHTMMKSSNCR